MDDPLKELDVCPFCGRVITGDPEFCAKCGARLSIRQPWWDVTVWPNALVIGLVALGGLCVILGGALLTGSYSGKPEPQLAVASGCVGAVLILIGVRVGKGS